MSTFKRGRVKLFPRSGYILLLVGSLLGFISFSFISVFYSGFQQRPFTGTPEKIEIEFLYTSEKQGWIEDVTPLFKEWFRRKFNIDVSVKLTVMGTHQTVNEILHGATPVAWSPASSIWIPYLNSKWINQGHKEPLIDKWTPLVITPTVIVCWESFYKENNVTGFRKLFNLAKRGVKFKYGHPDPLLSNGGTTATVMEFAAALNTTPDKLTLENLTAPKVLDFVKSIESKAVYYGSSTGFFGKWAAESGPSAIDCFAVYENIVLENSLKAFKMHGNRLIAVYPEEGVILNDHPYVILNGEWIDVWERFAASEYLLFLLSYESQVKAQKHGFRPVNPSVPLNTTIFSEENGVKSEFNVPVLSPPKGEVLDAVFTVWAKVRNPGVQG